MPKKRDSSTLLENRKAILVDSSPQAINITLNTLDYVDIEKIKYTYEVMKKDLDDLKKHSIDHLFP